MQSVINGMTYVRRQDYVKNYLDYIQHLTYFFFTVIPAVKYAVIVRIYLKV